MKKYIFSIILLIFILGIIVCKDQGSKITAQDKKEDKVTEETNPDKKVTLAKKKPAKRYKRKYSRLKGRIIDLTKEFLVIKKGRWEKKINFTDSMVIIDINKKEVDPAALDICQQVIIEASIKNKQRYAKKIKIVKEGDCLE